MSTSGEPADRSTLTVGTRVEVRSAFEWAGGFAVAAVVDDGYRLRRRSDGVELPATFPPDDVRRDRRTSMWWV